MKVDTVAATDAIKRMKTGMSRAVTRELRNMARDAALLARAHTPHNMDRKTIIWGLDGHGSFVHADGAAAAYDGSGTLETHFTHPIFPKAGSDRATWHWTPRPGQ